MTNQDTIVVNKRGTPAVTPANKANVAESIPTEESTDLKPTHNPTPTGKRVFEGSFDVETLKSPRGLEEGLLKAKTSEANFKLLPNGQSTATSDGIIRATTLPISPDELSKEKQLRQTIEELRKNKNWKEMLKYGEAKEPSGPVFINTGWTQKPNTIGSLVVAYLAFEASRNPEEISMLLPYFLTFIVQRLKEGNTIYNQHLLMLLYHSLDYADESFIQLFVEKGGLGPLIVFFLSDQFEMRQIAAAVCDKLYKDRPEIQYEFLRQQGGNKLVQLLVREWEDEESLKDIVIHILNLIEVTLEGSDEPSTILPNAEKIEQAMIRDILENLDPNQYSIETMELVDELLRALGENNKNGML